MNDWRLKSSYGEQGNMLNNQTTELVIKKGGMNSFYNEMTSEVAYFANPDLKWETTNSYNVGLDLNLFNNRIEFIADWYYKKTRDLLLQMPLPAYLGSSGNGAASNPWANVGSLRNTGIEMTLNTVNIDKSGFQWRSNFVFSLNRNKVISLDTESSFMLPFSKYIVHLPCSTPTI
jgi:outer membrane receptor protein involved in Fe transport